MDFLNKLFGKKQGTTESSSNIQSQSASKQTPDPTNEKDYGSKRFLRKRSWSVEVGTRNGMQLKEVLKDSKKGINYFTYYAEDLLDSEQLKASTKVEKFAVIRLRLAEIGIHDFTNDYDLILKRVKNEGLQLCPRLTAPEMAANNTAIIKRDEKIIVLSELILDFRGRRRVFGLAQHEGKLILDGYWVEDPWDPGRLVACRLR